MTEITIPEPSLVLLVGPTSSGKSTFAHRHFAQTEIVSSDACRALVSDDANALDVNREAFHLVHTIARLRLGRRRLVVIDATNVKADSRKPLLEVAAQFGVPVVAIVFNLPEHLLIERSQRRPDRDLGPHVVRTHIRQLRRSLQDLENEGVGSVHVLGTPDEVDAVVIERRRHRGSR